METSFVVQAGGLWISRISTFSATPENERECATNSGTDPITDHYVTLGKVLNRFGSQFSHLLNEGNNTGIGHRDVVWIN